MNYIIQDLLRYVSRKSIMNLTVAFIMTGPLRFKVNQNLLFCFASFNFVYYSE